MDPEVIAALLARPQRAQRLATLTPRELEVLALIAEGRSNAAIAQRLVITEKAVDKHVSHILDKLDLPPSSTDHRRVLAVLAYLDTQPAQPAATPTIHCGRTTSPEDRRSSAHRQPEVAASHYCAARCRPTAPPGRA